MTRCSIPLLTLLLGMTLMTPLSAEEKDRLGPSITVNGTGKVTARPDMAELQVGVVTQSAQAADALRRNSEAMSQLRAALDSKGIAERDIQTSSFQVTPQRRREPRGQQTTEIVGYQVTNLVRIRVRQLDQLGSLLDEVVQRGANQIHGIGFTVAEPEALEDEARGRAVADARRKAALYAEAAEVELGRILRVEEPPQHFPRPAPMAFARAEMMSDVPVAEGELEFPVTVTVTYALGAE